MSEKGWIHIDRKLLDHWLWSSRPFSRGQAWIDLLMLAKHKDQTFYSGGKIIEGKRGVVYRSLKSLADRWAWDRKTVRGFLKLLEKDGMVTTESTTQGTTITIVNYDVYQDIGTTNRTTESPTDWTTMGQRSPTQTDNDGTTMGQRSPTYKNVKNDKNNIGIGNNYTSFSSHYDGDGGKQPLGSYINQPSIEEYESIIQSWNEIPHTINIDSIIPGTRREDETRIVIGMYGMDGLKGAIQRVKDSVYLQRIGHVKYDSYINRNVVQKLLEGSYDEDYGTQRGGYTGELGIDWEAVEHDSSQLSSC